MRRSALQAVSSLCAGMIGAGQVLHAQPATFTGLGVLPGTAGSRATAISGDGTTVVGVCDNQGFRWRPGTSMVGAGASVYTPTAVSADGSDAVGILFVPPSGYAARWTEGAGIHIVNLSGGSYEFHSGVAMAAVEGSMVGTVSRPGDTRCPGSKPCTGSACFLPELRAYEQNHGGGAAHRLSALPGFDQSVGVGVCADGSVVVGESIDYCGGPFGLHLYQPCVWVGHNPIPVGVAGYSRSVAGVSGDGSAVVGGRSRAYRWTAGTGSLELGALPRWLVSAATAANWDGSVVVGVCASASGAPGAAFVWEEGRGMRDLRTELQSLGVPMVGWTLYAAVGVSWDGRRITGFGRTPAGTEEAWVAFLGDSAAGCYANCDGSMAAPVLNVNDFTCFLNRFAAGDSYANCDQSTANPLLNVNDFTCFVNAFAGGCG